MKNKSIKYIVGALAFIFVVSSCSNNDELASVTIKKTDVGYVVKDGYIKFNNVRTYDSTVRKMAGMERNELVIFQKSLGYISLYDTYTIVGAPIDSLNQRVEDEYLSRLLNKDGVLMVGDTILKIVNENAYIIPDGDFQKVVNIEKLDLSKNSQIKVVVHSKRFVAKKSNEDNGMQKLRGGASKYDGIVETGLIKPGTTSVAREERVKLGAFCVISPFFPFGLTYIGAEMNGEARHKDVWNLWGPSTWGSWFADEIDYGKITINSGKYGYEPTYVSNVTPGFLEFNTPQIEDKYGLEYGAYNDMSAKDLNVTYTYRKNSAKPIRTTNVIWN